MINVEKSIKLKKVLDELRPLKKEDELRILQKFRLDWNYHSNNLEGNTLTYGETKALILFGITAQGKPLKDHFEITGHDEAIKWVLEIVKQDRPITEGFIRELHKLVLKEPYEVDAITPEGNPTKKKVNVGVYKSTANHVKTKTGEIFRFATPEETPAMMSDLIRWYQAKADQKDINPILLAAEFHYKYIRIHPFDDVNGRTARILMNFILMQFNYPPVIIKTEDKESYFGALRQADAGLIEPFVEYISENLNRSLEVMIKGAKGESIEEPDDLEKEIALLEQKIKTVGQPVEVLKNGESLLSIYDHSIAKLIVPFVEKAKMFTKFYVKNRVKLNVDVWDKLITHDYNIIASGRNDISKGLKVIQLNSEYYAFKQVGFEEFNHTSSITFQFSETRYSVRTPGGLSLEKLYGEQLTDQEISDLVNSEIRRHKLVIERKIEEINKKK